MSYVNKICFIGAGNMATSIACGLLKANVFNSSQCQATEIYAPSKMKF